MVFSLFARNPNHEKAPRRLSPVVPTPHVSEYLGTLPRTGDGYCYHLFGTRNPPKLVQTLLSQGLRTIDRDKPVFSIMCVYWLASTPSQPVVLFNFALGTQGIRSARWQEWVIAQFVERLSHTLIYRLVGVPDIGYLVRCDRVRPGSYCLEHEEIDFWWWERGIGCLEKAVREYRSSMYATQPRIEDEP